MAAKQCRTHQHNKPATSNYHRKSEDRPAKARERLAMRARHGVKMSGRRYWLPRCGAMTRKGTPCKRKPVLLPDGQVRNGRCRNHAGCSTGPRTIEGHARCLEGRLKLYAARRAAGLPAIVRKPKPAPVRPARPAWYSPTPAERRQRVIADLKVRFPDRNWDD
jgi:hypothetical protein